MKVRISAAMMLLGFSIMLAGAGLVTHGVATATRGHDDNVRICHRTNSVTNPYVSETVDPSAIDGEGNNDHTHHTGPVFDPGAVYPPPHNGDQWGDIIPGVLNWTEEGINVWTNGCNVSGSEPSPTASATATGTATSTPPSGTTSTPTSTDTDTPTPPTSPTDTSTNTPTATDTPTVSVVRSATPTNTSSATSTTSVSSTATPTVSGREPVVVTSPVVPSATPPTVSLPSAGTGPVRKGVGFGAAVIMVIAASLGVLFIVDGLTGRR